MLEEKIDLVGINLIKQGGDAREKGVNILYKKYARILRALFLKETRIQADADDLVQETFIKIVKGCNSYKGDAPLSAWIRKIAKNCLIDHLRSKKSHLTENFDDEGWEMLENTSEHLHVVDPPVNGDSLEDCVERGLREFAKVEPERANALSLLVDGFDSKKIASITNRSEGGIREYLSQCRKKIEEYLIPCRDYVSAN